MSFILVSLSFGIIHFLLPSYSKSLGLSATEIGGMSSILSFMALLLKSIVGRQGIASAFFEIAIYSMSVSSSDKDKVGQQIGSVQSVQLTCIFSRMREISRIKGKGIY